MKSIGLQTLCANDDAARPGPGGAADRPTDPAREQHRLATLASYDILDTMPEAAFDRVVELAQALFETPIALVSFVDAERQWFKAQLGVTVSETPREYAFCDHAIRQDGVMVIPDARIDPRFASNPLVLGGPRIRFYAGAPMVTPDGSRLGTVCVISPEPRASLTRAEQQQLTALADIVSSELELRRQMAQARKVATERALLIQEVDHRVSSSLRLVTCVLEAQASRSTDRVVRQALYEAVDRIVSVERTHAQLRRGGDGVGEDVRLYLLALIGNLQDAAVDEAAGRTIALSGAPQWLLPSDRLARLGMVVTELVTNALKHGAGTVDVRVEREEEGLTVAVTDEGSGFGVRRQPLLSDNRLGLQIVSMLAAPGGMTVDPFCPRRIIVRMGPD